MDAKLTRGGLWMISFTCPLDGATSCLNISSNTNLGVSVGGFLDGRDSPGRRLATCRSRDLSVSIIIGANSNK